MTTSTITRGTGVSTSGNKARSSLYAPSLDGITRRHRVEPHRNRDGNASTIDVVPAEADPTDSGYIVPGSRLTSSEFSEVVAELKESNDSAAERERQCDPKKVEANLPQPKKARRNYFDETPKERRVRQQIAKAERIAEREEQLVELLANDDREGLFHLYHFLVRFFARKLQLLLEFDDFTRDDVEQAGSIGLWNAAQKFREGMGAPFAGFANKCINNEMWKEFDSRKKQQKRGFSQGTDYGFETMPSGKPRVEEELADTEMLGVVARKLSELQEDKQFILKRKTDGETFRVISSDIGISQTVVRRKYYLALEGLQEVVFPLSVGAWVPWPCFVGDVWRDLESAQKQFSQPPERKRMGRECEICGAEHFKNLQAKFCSKFCKNRANSIRRRLAHG